MDNGDELSRLFDLGHRDDVDRTLIVRMLALTPDERLDRHEGWRLFVKEAQARAVLSLSQLIETKEAAGRPKDLAVLPVLKATLELKRKG